MIKQFVPQDVCLKCQGCCRFSRADSVWAPCLMDEEIQELLDKDLPPALLSIDKRIRPIPNPEGEGFICPFLGAADNKCKIYNLRPFECRLYPFLISFRGKKIILTVDLNCPYIKDKLGTKALKDYIDHLASFLNTPEQIELLKDNLHMLQAYEEVQEVIELRDIDEAH